MTTRQELRNVFLVYIAISAISTAAFLFFGELFFAPGYYFEGTWFSFNPLFLVAGPALGFSLAFGSVGLVPAIGVGLVGGPLSAVMIASPRLCSTRWSYAVSAVGIALWLLLGLFISGLMY